ncbi:hypothetical protein MHYP_G00179710 [Metynnis hypsauchen]
MEMSYMMINFTQVSPSRLQVRIDGIEEGDPSSRAGGAVSEFRKSVPNHTYKRAATDGRIEEVRHGDRWLLFKLRASPQGSLANAELGPNMKCIGNLIKVKKCSILVLILMD